ncbi:MAG TPA: TlpA disulfide reductase family protein [Gemmatimonadaceae bacterium]|nr:TlpA disulfide reductase family protein [Gemmatimonadaceae bacterium]
MSERRQWALVGGAVAIVALGVGVAARVVGGDIARVEAGARAPDFRAVPIALDASRGAAVPTARTLADYRGKVVLLNLWATWCNPCRAEMPSMERLRQEMEPQGLRIVAVSIDNPGMEEAIRDFAKEYGLRFEILYDDQGKIRDDYQSTGVPETFIIGRDGIIRKRVIAAADWNAEAQKALLRQLLAEPGP